MTVTLSGPADVVIGAAFTVTVQTTPPWSGTGNIDKPSGSAYNTFSATETYWDVNKQPQTTPSYTHERGVFLPTPATLSITNGAGSFQVTQFTMQPFSVRVTLQGTSYAGLLQYTKEHVWAYVQATYIGNISHGPEEGHTNDPGYFDNNLSRAALPYGSPLLLNQYLVGERNLGDAGVEMKIRDRGPWFPYDGTNHPGATYPAAGASNWSRYNDYWAYDNNDDAGWHTLANDMSGLRRAGDQKQYVINGSGLDLTMGSISALGFTWNSGWSGSVYWRFR